ncbi:MAG TPA: histidine phosphatase family protein [Bryobacteraceae bacterium]|nr:histidine phosphatase family protein [Bryobacteraceae bacterium]
MRIYILRHGIAEDRGKNADDAKRALTAEGRAKLRLVLLRARVAEVDPALILTSPLVRAVQTARLAASLLGRKPVAVTDALLPTASPQDVWREIKTHSDEPSLLLAGHEPLLGETASWMLGFSRTVIDLKKGALLSIAIDNLNQPQRGVLEWLLTPKLCRDSAK